MADDILEYWMSLSRELAHKYHMEQFDTSSAMWSWDNFGDDIKSLKNRLGVNSEYVELLGLRVDLGTGKTVDMVTGKETRISKILPHLYYYSKARDKGIGGEWVKFNTLRGSWACRYSFNEEDLDTLAKVFVEKRNSVIGALERLGGKKADYGDVAYELSVLPKVKVLVVFEDADDEFPASVRLLYDNNSIFYLPHEMLGDVTWLLTSRVMMMTA
jgi:hypothetical protein